jgi:hypothetical protein
LAVFACKFVGKQGSRCTEPFLRSSTQVFGQRSGFVGGQEGYPAGCRGCARTGCGARTGCRGCAREGRHSQAGVLWRLGVGPGAVGRSGVCAHQIA